MVKKTKQTPKYLSKLEEECLKMVKAFIICLESAGIFLLKCLPTYIRTA